MIVSFVALFYLFIDYLGTGFQVDFSSKGGRARFSENVVDLCLTKVELLFEENR